MKALEGEPNCLGNLVANNIYIYIYILHYAKDMKIKNSDKENYV